MTVQLTSCFTDLDSSKLVNLLLILMEAKLLIWWQACHHTKLECFKTFLIDKAFISAINVFNLEMFL